jgi:hypothetical protein
MPATISLLLMVSRRRGETVTSLLFTAVPFAQAWALIATTLDGFAHDALECFDNPMDARGYTVLVLLATLAYGLLSLAFLWRAVRAFRRRIV